MLRFNRVVAVLLVCGMAGFTYAKADKSKEVFPAGAGEDLNPGVSGMAIANFHDSSTPATEVQLVVRGLEPNTTYGVIVVPGFNDMEAFTTNASGNASYHHKVLWFDITLEVAAQVVIFVWDGDPNTQTEVTFDEARAYACVGEGECTFDVSCQADADCDTGFACFRDTCDGGVCYHEIRDPDCDDGDICTADACTGVDGDGNTTCEHVPVWDPGNNCTPF